MPYLWDDQAWADYQYWLTQDKKTLRRICWCQGKNKKFLNRS